MDDTMENYMYGQFEDDVRELACSNGDVFQAMVGPPAINPVYLREDLVRNSMPFFGGDNVDGLITYVKKLEQFILNG